MTAKKKTNQVSGARESNAGDDFHVLWAARRALSLLDPSTELKGITVEGPEPNESYNVDPTGDLLLGIDLAEYYGDVTLEGADQVVYSQLKYSTRRSTERWTAARLCRGKKGGYAGSVIHRLGLIMHAYLQDLGRDLALEKIKIKLVSNQHCDDSLMKAIAKACETLEKSPEPMQFRQLQPRIRNDLQIPLQVLRKATTNVLSSSQFCDFLRMLDLRECGTDSRLNHSHALYRELGQVGVDDTRTFYLELKSFIHQRMMPENRNAGIITVADLAPVFKLADTTQLFPAASHITTVVDYVPREQEHEFAQTVLNAKDKIVCLHGSAGSGKTTIAESLSRHMPTGSVSVLFDCYGGGSYLDPSQERHSHGRAIPQIANELATIAGSAYLIDRRQSDEDLLRLLIRRLEFAGVVAREVNPAAVVTLVIDAADNSITAARERSDTSFITDLLNCELPDSCRLVVSCRTHRRDLLDLPANVVEVEVQTFTVEESAKNLARVWPDATEQESMEFHRRSNGIPRVQGYALELNAQSVQKVLALLNREGTTVESLLVGLVQSAFKRLGPDHKDSDVLPVLLSFPRPAPIESVATVAQVAPQVFEDLSHDLMLGFSVESGFVKFRDEDFENFLRDNYGPTPDLLDRVADYLYSKSDKDDYAACAVADALQCAGRYKDIISLVHREEQPKIVSDPIQRKEVFARRARLALQSILKSDDRAELMKLMFIVADAAKIDRAVERMLLDNLDIACRYGEPDIIERLYLNEASARIDWYGPTHMQCAAHYARNEATHDRAQNHLRLAEAWLNHWSSLPKKERKEWSVDIKDAAFETEAILRLLDNHSAARWLDSWRPKPFRFSVLQQLASNMITIEGTNIRRFLRDISLRADESLAIINAMVEAGLEPPANEVQHTFNIWYRFVKLNDMASPVLHRPGILLCEAAIRQGIDSKQVATVAKFFAPPPTQYRSGLYDTKSRREVDTFLRSRSILHAIDDSTLEATSDLLYPPELHPKTKVSMSDESAMGKAKKQEKPQARKDLEELYAMLLPSSNARANLLVGKEDMEGVLSKLAQTLGTYSVRWHRDDQGVTQLRAEIVADAAASFGHLPVFKEVCQGIAKKQSIELELSLANRALATPELSATAVELVDRVYQSLVNQPLSGAQQLEYLVRCCRIAGEVDKDLGKFYFDAAVESASEIDEEAMTLLRTLSSLAIRAGCDDRELVDSELAVDLACLTESCHWRLVGWDHFPWKDCIEAISTLSPTVAITALARWDMRGVLNYADHMMTLAEISCARKAISKMALVAWLLLSDLRDRTSIRAALDAAKELEPAHRDTAFSLIVDFVERLAPFENREYLIQVVGEWMSEPRIQASDASQRVDKILQFLITCKSEEGPESFSFPIREKERTEIDSASKTIPLDQIINGRDYCSSHDLTAMLEIVNPVTDRIRGFPFQDSDLVQALMDSIADKLKPKEFIKHLDAIIEIGNDVLSFKEMVSTVQRRLEKWDYHAGVRDWKGKFSDRISASHFAAFVWNDHLSTYEMDRVAEAIGSSRESVLASLIRVLPDHLDELSAAAVYDLTNLFVKKLPEDEAISILRWAVSRYQQTVKQENLSVRAIEVNSIPKSGIELEAYTLWGFFGHPDTRVRWRAIHAARVMVRLGQTELIHSLNSRFNDQSHLFCLPGTRFYWCAAQTWYMLLIDELSINNPLSVLPIVSALQHEVLSPMPPNALAVRFAKRALLRVIEQSIGFNVTRAMYAKIESAQRPEIVAGKADLSLASRYQTGDRFKFDTLETIPYWYQPLANVFGISVGDLVLAAERWICDEWGIEGDAREEDPIRQMTRDSDWSLRSHSQGSLPVVEDLRTHLEFYTMLCCAGDFAASREVHQGNWEEDPWEYWISCWDLIEVGGWISDDRQCTPLELQFWRAPHVRGVDWSKDPTDFDFEFALGIHNPLNPGYLVVHADMGQYDYERSESVNIKSALVAPETASALLHALDLCIHPADYRIPIEGDELEFAETVEGMAFNLTGWIRSTYEEGEGIDSHDPFRNCLGRTTFAPGASFTDYAGLLPHQRGRQWVNCETSEVIGIFDRWDDSRPSRYESGFRTDGLRLWIRWKELSSFLKSKERCLIVACDITRNSRRSGDDKEREYVKTTKLYIIHQDGRVETPSRDHSSRQENS